MRALLLRKGKEGRGYEGDKGLSYWFKMVFTADDKLLINSLRQLKGYSSRRFLKEFLQKN